LTITSYNDDIGQKSRERQITMVIKMRSTILLFIILMLLASVSMAGDQFNLLTGNNEFDTTNEHGFVFLEPWWKLQNKSGDRIDCTGEFVTAFSGDCSFRFKGSATEASRLIQVVSGTDLDTLNGFVNDADVSLQMAYQVNSLSTKTKLKTKTIVTIEGSSTNLKSLANFAGTTRIGEFTSWEAVSGTQVTIPQGAVVTKVKVIFANRSTGGKVFIDNVEVLFASMGS
jgi:hypothetical protein